jgi:hypothetical protein
MNRGLSLYIAIFQGSTLVGIYLPDAMSLKNGPVYYN